MNNDTKKNFTAIAMGDGVGGVESRITVIIVEDHALVREALRALLSLDQNIEVVGEAANGLDAVHMASTWKPMLILMDLSMPGMNGMEAIREIRRRYSEARIIVITAHKTEEYIRVSLQAGASGYIFKDTSHAELMVAIKRVMEGKTYLSQDVSERLVVHHNGNVTDSKLPWETLTHRERIVLKLIAEGRQNKSIADYLCISIKTVEKHRSNLMKKLNLHNTAAITAFAIERRVVESAI